MWPLRAVTQPRVVRAARKCATCQPCRAASRITWLVNSRSVMACGTLMERSLRGQGPAYGGGPAGPCGGGEGKVGVGLRVVGTFRLAVPFGNLDGVEDGGGEVRVGVPGHDGGRAARRQPGWAHDIPGAGCRLRTQGQVRQQITRPV